MNIDAGRQFAREQRRAARRRKQLEKRLRKPWLIFRRLLRSELFEHAAMAATGLGDFGDGYYAEGLEGLFVSLRRDAHLKVIGRLMMQRAVVIALKQRLLLVERRKTDPQFFKGPLLPPIIVTGLPRTGTTHLHRLLAEDPASHAPSLEELVMPIPPETKFAAFVNRKRIATELAALRFMAGGGLDSMHMSRIDQPEECMFALAMSFRTMLFWTIAPCYSYMDWYSRSARTGKYHDYRDILLLLQARNPGRRLILKAPDHLGSIDQLLTAVPEAQIVVCHRRVADTVTSFNSLIHSIHRTISGEPDPVKIGETNLSYFEAETRNYVAARRKWKHRLLEIDYDRLLESPIAIVSAIYEKAGLEFTPELIGRFQAYVGANPKDKLGRHHYQPSDYGQSATMIAERLAHYTIEPAAT